MFCSGIVREVRVSWATGTLDALDWTTYGGVTPGGIARNAVWQEDVICAIALPMSIPGWKNTLMSPTPGIDSDSIRETPLTVADRLRSLR